MNDKCTPIKECIACGSDRLFPVLDLGTQPLANSYKLTSTDPEEEFPLAINRCMDCCHVQLTHQVDPSLMFKHYRYMTGVSAAHKTYLEWFMQLAMEQCRGAIRILDIGCNDGTFLDVARRFGFGTYGVDPAENLYEISSKNHDIHCGFFTGEEFPEHEFDIITCMNAFAHNSNQLELLKNIGKKLYKNGVAIVTTSQADMILNGEFDTIYHEHVSFYNTQSMQCLCERAGLHLVNVFKHDIHGTSYIFVIRKNKVAGNVEECIAQEKEKGLYSPETYDQFAHKARMTAWRFSDTIRAMRMEGYTIVGYSAPAKGNTFMNFSKVRPDFIIDDTPLKQGTFTPGLSVPILGPEYLDNYKSFDKLCFVPFAWNFYDEIVGRIKSIRPDKHDVFVRYFPTFEVTE